MKIQNKILSKLPTHLKSFIVDQNYDRYTYLDQAVWRYVMRRNMDYLKDIAHESYSDGLQKTGISIDRIPRIEEMNEILGKIGWAAVTVDGFIPPNAFMEFQAYNTLVIASDIRTSSHIEYTPAPDIIHEAAGHAPIISNPEYAEYLRRFGEIGSKAISSAKDYELYEAIRHLSIIKEDPRTNEKSVREAENEVEEISKNMGEPSEMSKIRNLHWWTVEYGLIGEISDSKIYGAGLLSSIGESKLCMSSEVEKLEYSVNAANVEFDITKPQPHLFVTSDFAHLSFVLEEYANDMALRSGGLQGIVKLVNSKDLGTVELSTGVQISGNVVEVIKDQKGNPIYFKTKGPTALAYKNKELIGHDKSYHADGFGSPIGKLKSINLAIENMSPRDLEAYGIYEGRQTCLEFAGGVKVEGTIITGKRNLQGKIILISFKECTVKYNDRVLFEPSWGTFDMVVGEEVVSAFSGVADPESYGLEYEPPKEKTHQIKYSAEEIELHKLYKKVREIRNSVVNKKKLEIDDLNNLLLIFNQLKSEYKNDWLLSLEIFEIFHSENKTKEIAQVLKYLNNLSAKPELLTLILEGVDLIKLEKFSLY